MIGYIVLGLAVLGVGLIILAWHTGKSENPDDAASMFIPAFFGVAFLAADAVLVAGYALYRLFF